jgi:multiple sugar transport system substrate-binding protein
VGDFSPAVLEQVRYDGKLMGLVLDVHPQGLYMNAAMLREAGCVDGAGNARAPRDAAEFVDVARRLRDASAGRWGFSTSNLQTNYLSLLPQFGGWLMDGEGNPTLDAPGCVAALEAFTRLVREEGIAPPPENALGWVGFRQKRVAMVWDGIFMLGDLKRLEGLEYLAAPMPRFGPEPGVHGDSHVVCVRAGISAEKRAAALRLVRFLSGRSLDWADAGQVPARASARATERFRGMAVQHAFAEQLDHVRYPPRTPIQAELLVEVSTAVERALRGRASPAEALKDAQENALRFVERERRERGAAK